ncbi:MAG TPA: hypothetical protein VG073_03855, partial [Gaiellaceae bacterium]|nr:hypothetical protein [Gaiellaceae bacterium]
ERLEAYMEKALREAKRSTGWVEPNQEHERHVREFCRALYADRAWRADFEPFAAAVAEEGRRVSLAMTLLKLTLPGVPDIYQGDELESLALVDPDNRRPVDWELRRRLLRERSDEKLELIRRVLAVRDGFGGYLPVDAGSDIVAFHRGAGWLVVVPLRPAACKSLPEAATFSDLLPEYPVGLFQRA